MAVVNLVLYNAALNGFVSGILTQRLNVPDSGSTAVTAGILFATEVDAILQTVSSPPANIAALLNGASTRVPSTSAQANAAESLPVAMSALAKAAWEGRPLPVASSTNLPFVAADYQPVANSVVQAFVQYAANTNNT